MTEKNSCSLTFSAGFDPDPVWESNGEPTTFETVVNDQVIGEDDSLFSRFISIILILYAYYIPFTGSFNNSILIYTAFANNSRNRCSALA